VIREPERRSSRLARRLGELARRRSLGESLEGWNESDDLSPLRAAGSAPYAKPEVAADVTSGTRVPVGIDELLEGGVLADVNGSVFVHERLRSSIERFDPAWGRLRASRKPSRRVLRTGIPGPEWLWQSDGDDGWRAPWESENGAAGELESLPEEPPDARRKELNALAGMGLERVLFLDLETGGLGGACIFLAGVMRRQGDDYVVRQYFARDYGEEAALVARVAREIAEADALVTFNGKSFDLPLLRDRAVRHRLPSPSVATHVDLLRHARAAWAEQLPDCRLTTLEAYVCHRRRSGDIPGDRVPALYHDFVRQGGAERLLPVFHHNLLDVLTMEELLRRLYAE
jgi:uncharacterized protein YprB with RNaseH-like and TPR domain